MRMYRIGAEKSKRLGMAVYLGIDLHRRAWHVTVRTKEMELFSGSTPGRWEALVHLLERYQCAKLLKKLAETGLYRERVKILRTVPCVGLISAMEILLELQDVPRFREAKHLAAYVRLTPSQCSSAEKVRMGRITGIGRNSVRATLVEVAWQSIGKDAGLRHRYDQLKNRCEAKRAIVAIARVLLLRIRRMLLDSTAYMPAMAQ